MAKILIVVPRFGEQIVGGSEQLAYSIAHNLSKDNEVEVYTTRAKEYITWPSHFREGVEMDGKVRVHRFNISQVPWKDKDPHTYKTYMGGLEVSSDFVQDMIYYNKYSELQRIKSTPVGISEMFIREVGPYSKDMLDSLAHNRNKWDKVLFIPYLYATTLYGARMLDPNKVVIIPAAHDEPYLYYPCFKEYSRYNWAVFYPTEAAMIERAIGSSPKSWDTLTVQPRVSRVTKPNEHPRKSIVCVGRISEAKCYDRLIKALERARAESEVVRKYKLEFIGSIQGSIPGLIKGKDWIKVHGELSTQARDKVVNSCSFMINPSLLDSLGLVNLESMMSGTPVVVNNTCPAFNDLARISDNKVLVFDIYSDESLIRAVEALDTLPVRNKVAHEQQQWACATFTEQKFSEDLRRII